MMRAQKQYQGFIVLKGGDMDYLVVSRDYTNNYVG